MSTFNELWGRSTPNSWARVPRGPVAAAVGSFFFGATATAFTIAGTAITWGTIGGFLITTAVASWAMSALMPKPQGVSGREGMLSNRREPVRSFDIVYGKVRKGGNITFMESTGSENKYLHFVIALAGHEVEAIESVYINEDIVTLDTNGFVNADPWKGKVRIKEMLGGPNQTAQPQLVAETSVNSSFRGRGIAYLYVRLEYDNEVFADGIPNFTAVVKGKRVFDPRTNTTVWSDNAALCIRDYLRDPLGVNSVQSPASLTSDSWTVGANVCDTLITKADSSKEKQYTLNGIVPTSNTPRENLQQMLTSCGGTLFWGQGQWQFKAGYFPSGPYVNLGMDDLRSGISLVTKNSRKENFNSVSGVFVNENKDWVETEYPRVSSSVFLAQDNGQENSLDMELPFTTSPSAAQRLAKMAMFRSREEMVISANFSLKAAKVKVGDVVRFSFERYGFTNKYFEVLSWKLVSESDGLVINMTLKETSADAYNWNAEEKDILGNNTILPQPREGLTVSGLVVTNRQTLQSDGTFLGEVLLSWNAAENAFVYRYDVQWRKDAESAWSSTQTTETEVVIPSIKSGVSYIYRVRAVSVGGFVGAWEQIGATVSGKDTPPGLPTNVQTKNLYRAVQVTWENPTDRDLNHIEIYTNTSNTTTGATKVGESGGTKFIYDMEPTDSRWFFLRAVDHSGNKSGFTAGKEGTALFIEQSDVNINVDRLLEDAGLSAVEVLGTLPTTGNTVGRTVYLTTDQQLYTWNGTAWEKSVNADVGELELQNFPPDLRPVEVVSTLPTTGNVNGRTVVLTTDGKLYRYHSGSWTASVPTADLTGQLTSSQIASLEATKVSGQLTDAQIADIAASKVTGRLTDAQISGVAAAKVTGQMSTAQIANNAITALKLGPLAVEASKLANNAVTSTKIGDGAVTTPKLVANAVVADKIAANAITASKLAVVDLTNIIPDSEMLDSNSWTLPATWVLSQNPANSGFTAPGALNYLGEAATTGFSSPAVSKRFPVDVNNDYFFRYQTYSETGNNNGVLGRIHWFGATGAEVGSPRTIGAADPGSGNRTFEASFKPVAFAKYAEIRFYVNRALTTGAVLISSLVGRVKSNAELIVDGAITTDKIFAKAITSGKIDTGAVTADSIAANAVTADKVSAGAIETAKLAAGAVVADKIAANAVTAGKVNANVITSREIITGGVIADNIAANAVTADKISSNAITSDKIEANAITSNKIEANAVTAGKISAGAISADKIQANAVLASKLYVGDTTNAVVEADFSEGAVNWRKGSGLASSFEVSDISHTGIGKYMYRIRPQTPGVYHGSFSKPIPVTPGSDYNVSVRAYSNSATNILRVNYFNAQMGLISYIDFSSATLSWDLHTTNFKTPGNCHFIEFAFYVRDDIGDSSSYVQIVNPTIRKAASSELIVDGAIKANHMSANSVTAGIIAAGAVSATAIQSGAVTADKINVNSLSAISANLGSIQVGTANIANGAITNAKIGDLEVDTLKLTNGAVTVFDVVGSGEVLDDAGGGWKNVCSMSLPTNIASQAVIGHVWFILTHPTTDYLSTFEVEVRINGELVVLYNRHSRLIDPSRLISIPISRPNITASPVNVVLRMRNATQTRGIAQSNMWVMSAKR